MPVVNDQGRVVADEWACALTEEDAPASGAIVPLSRLPSLVGDARSAGTRLGVFLPGDTRPESVVPYLDRLELIAIDFPKFRDGRGFSLARSLREHHGFHGEIRAVGHVLPDQFPALLGCGFTSIQVPAGQAVERWAEALSAPGRAGEKRSSQLLARLIGHPIGRND